MSRQTRQFVVGLLQGIQRRGNGEIITARHLDVLVAPDIHLDVYDSSFGKVPLTLGEQYDLLISPQPYKYRLEQSPGPLWWTSQVLAVDWEIPLEQFTHVRRRKAPIMPRVHPDNLLVTASFGRVVLSYSSLYTMAHITHDQITVSTPICWEKIYGFSLQGIV